MDEERLRELFQSLPEVRVRQMFGGQGIYSGSLIVGLVTGGDIYLKSDAATDADFETAGCPRWTYKREGRTPVRMPYYRLPDDALDDPELMMDWAAKALAAALRSGKPAPRGRSSRRS